jgi:glycosyltransferase involved in cell wall biosynthesis
VTAVTSDAPIRVFAYEPYAFGKRVGNIRNLLGILEYAPASGVHCIVAAPFDSDLGDQVRELGAEWTVMVPPAATNRYGGKILGESLFGRLWTVLVLMAFNWRLRRYLKDERIDLLYCNSIRSLLMVGVAGRLAGVPSAWYVKGELSNGLLDRVGLLLANRVHFFCGPNRDDKYRWMVRWLSRKIDVVGNGVDLAPLRAAQSAQSSIDDDLAVRTGPRIGYLGQLYPLKGVHFLVDAFARVAGEFPDATLYLIGDSIIAEYEHYVEQLKNQIRAHGIEGRVVFTGWRADAFAIVNRMTIVVHPSTSEGFGLVVAEAMALGKPVIATRVGALRELVRDGVNGFAFDVGDVDTLTDRLRQLLADPALRERLGAAARKTVESEYQLEDKMRQLYRIWHDAVRDARGEARSW